MNTNPLTFMSETNANVKNWASRIDLPLDPLYDVVEHTFALYRQGGESMGHLLNPWWVTGPVYATGRHSNGHVGTIYSAPYGTGGADVEITASAHPAATPWFCGCDRLQAAFFSAALFVGPGWCWNRSDRNSNEADLILHTYLDVNTRLKRDKPAQLVAWAVEQAIGRSSVHRYHLRDAIHDDPLAAPEVISHEGANWLRYQVAFRCQAEHSRVRFGQVYRDEAIRLVALSVSK